MQCRGELEMVVVSLCLLLLCAGAQAGYVEDGRAALEAQDPATAQTYFQQALNSDPTDPEANFGMALAETALLVNDPAQDVVDILDSFQVSQLDVYNLGALLMPEDIPGSADTVPDVQNALRTHILPELDSIIESLVQVEAAGNWGSTITPLMQPDYGMEYPGLFDGQPLTIPDAEDPWDEETWVVDVPSGRDQVVISTTGGTGECNLYVQYGDEPDPWLPEYDYASETAGTAESVTITTPTAGRWYILVVDTGGTSGWSGVQLEADWSPDGERYCDNTLDEVDQADIKGYHAVCLAAKALIECLTAYELDVDYSTVQADHFDLQTYIEDNADLFTLKTGGVGSGRMAQARLYLQDAVAMALDGLDEMERETDEQIDDFLKRDVEQRATARAWLGLLDSALDGPTEISGDPTDPEAPVEVTLDLNSFFGSPIDRTDLPQWEVVNPADPEWDNEIVEMSFPDASFNGALPGSDVSNGLLSGLFRREGLWLEAGLPGCSMDPVPVCFDWDEHYTDFGYFRIYASTDPNVNQSSSPVAFIDNQNPDPGADGYEKILDLDVSNVSQPTDYYFRAYGYYPDTNGVIRRSDPIKVTVEPAWSGVVIMATGEHLDFSEDQIGTSGGDVELVHYSGSGSWRSDLVSALPSSISAFRGAWEIECGFLPSHWFDAATVADDGWSVLDIYAPAVVAWVRTEEQHVGCISAEAVGGGGDSFAFRYLYPWDTCVLNAIWGVTDGQSVYRRSGVSVSAPNGTGWHKVPGWLKQVSVGSNRVWGTTNGDAVYFRAGICETDPGGSGWQRVAGFLDQVSVGPTGVVWGVTDGGAIYARGGVSSSNPKGTCWLRVPGFLKQVSVGPGCAWGVTDNDWIYFRSGVTNSDPTGDSWQRVPGYLDSLSVGSSGVLWGLTDSEAIYCRTGVTDADPMGTGWQRVRGRLSRVSVGMDSAWGVTGSDEIYRRSGVTVDTPAGSDWTRVPGYLRRVSAGKLVP